MMKIIDTAQEALAESFQTFYGYEHSAGILKYMEGEY